jgi:hypothetical protein
MLPSKPKIFYGHESELKYLIETLSGDSPRVVILGGVGMGKTSLARAALHQPKISAKFEDKYFISAESATTSIELAALIGLHLGFKARKDLTRHVVQYFRGKPLCLLILDNLESPWEPIHSRGGLEEFLFHLTDVPHLALIVCLYPFSVSAAHIQKVTSRGAERPAKVAWTHPLLWPPKPLSDEAAQQIFTDITDDFHRNEVVKPLLRLTDNIPLIVDLIAHESLRSDPS